MAVEFRVVWKRDGCRRKTKRFRYLKVALRKVGTLGPEPWTALGKDADAYHCCSGRECGCGGETWRTWFAHLELPPLEYIFIEEREIGTWRRPAVLVEVEG